MVKLYLLSFCWSALGLLLAMGESDAEITRPLFRTVSQLVLVPVTVTDHNNKSVEGLRAADFTIFDNQASQQIVSFSSDDAPCSVGLVLDVSGSMQKALTAARDILRAFFGTVNPEDEFLLLTVSTQPAMAPKFTTDIASLEESVGVTRSGGMTALIDTTYLALRRMKEARWPRRALLILSDGLDNHSRYSQSELMSVALEADVQVYTMIFDNGLASANTIPFRPVLIQKPKDQSGQREGPELLENLSNKTGGLSFDVHNDAEAKDAVTRTGRALRNEYLIGYRPSAAPRISGQFHRIRVKSSVPNVYVRARSGYLSR
jgi:Ca-activated chloride channel homolog